MDINSKEVRHRRKLGLDSLQYHGDSKQNGMTN